MVSSSPIRQKPVFAQVGADEVAVVVDDPGTGLPVEGSSGPS